MDLYHTSAERNLAERKAAADKDLTKAPCGLLPHGGEYSPLTESVERRELGSTQGVPVVSLTLPPSRSQDRVSEVNDRARHKSLRDSERELPKKKLQKDFRYRDSRFASAPEHTNTHRSITHTRRTQLGETLIMKNEPQVARRSKLNAQN